MKNNFHKGLKAIREVRLSPEERALVLSRLVEHAEKYPAPIVSPWKVYVSRFSVRVATAVLLVVALTGGSAALAAGGALPGDVLYPVKIHINEPVQSAFVTGSVPKARFETEKAVRRLEEIEALSSQGRLNQEAVQIVKDNFQKSADEFAAAVQEVEATASSTEATEVTEARIEFETKLEAHSSVLSFVEQDEEHPVSIDVASLRKDVEDRANKSKEQREERGKIREEGAGRGSKGQNAQD